MFGDKADTSRKGTDCNAGDNLMTSAQQPAAKLTNSKENATPKIVVMEEVARVVNLQNAFKRGEQNRGATGVDGQSVVAMRQHLTEVLLKLSKSLLDGSYNPGEIQRVWIPKAGGGELSLGILNLLDRVVQQVRTTSTVP